MRERESEREREGGREVGVVAHTKQLGRGEGRCGHGEISRGVAAHMSFICERKRGARGKVD